MANEYLVDLRRPPKERWLFDGALTAEARQLADQYLNDLGISDDVAKMICALAKQIMPDNYWLEIEGIAEISNVPVERILVCNVYYDLVKSVLGCTAFAVDTSTGPLHARNLDWWTENGLLNDTSFACRFVGAAAGEFVTIGWPGFTGALSGMAPGRFCITLNAVLSDEPMQAALPVSFLLRSIFENAESFGEAVEMLCSEVIPCDCLLLVTGTKLGEMVVIERSPTKHAVRRANQGRIAVANDYVLLDADESSTASSELRDTSTGRFGRISELLVQPPTQLDQCLDHLSDPAVQMSITVQQMAFHAQSGDYKWRKI